MLISKYFHLEDLIPPEVYETFRDESIRFIGSTCLPNILDFMYSRYGKIYVNTWKDGGEYENSGYRSPYCKEGAKYSIHKLGLAADPKSDKKNSLDIQADIKKNYDRLYRPLGLRALERDTKGWTHISCQLTRSASLVLLNP